MAEEPSNAVLATKIEALAQQIARDRKDELAYHERLDTRLEQMTSVFALLQQQVNVQKAQTDAKIQSIEQRDDRHDQFHEREQKASEERRERGVGWTTALSNVIIAAAAILTVAVTLLIVH